MMKVADAHCDTLTEYSANPFHTEKAHWNVDKFSSVGGLLQYMAVYTAPEFSGDSALRYAARHLGIWQKQKPDIINLLEKKEDFKDDKINIILSLEGASPIIDDINNLYAFYKLGVRAITLTWNHRNFVADGVDNNYGLTQFGKEVIAEMEKLGMIIDVSHICEAGFDDVVKYSSKPFIASHSNAYYVHNHRRNLKDEQIQEIINRKGFIGINLYSTFLGNEDEDIIEKMVKHIDYCLKIGAGDVLGFGADFDGITKCPFEDCRAYKTIQYLLKTRLSLDEEQIEKIMYKNLVDYTLRMI